MKKFINLFQRPKPKEIPIVIQRYTRLGTRVGILLFVLFLGLSGYFLYLKNQIKTVEDEKRTLLNYVMARNTVQAQISYLLMKRNQLNEFLAEDAEFLTYQSHMNKLIEESNIKVQLEGFTIDNKQNTQFTVIVTKYADLFAFLKYMESSTVLKQFISLSVDKMDFGGDNADRLYKLNFQGRFEPIHEKSLK